MTKDEALRYLYYAAKMKELLTIGKCAEHNAKVIEAANVLAIALGLNFEAKKAEPLTSSPPPKEDQQ